MASTWGIEQFSEQKPSGENRQSAFALPASLGKTRSYQYFQSSGCPALGPAARKEVLAAEINGTEVFLSNKKMPSETDGPGDGDDKAAWRQL